MLVERMTFGPGADSLIALPQARIFSRSAAGHQLAVDSSIRVTAADDPSLMGAFGAALKFSWPGRLPGDSLSVQFPFTDSLQRIWMMRGRVIIRLPQLPGDPRWLRVSIGIEDSNQLFFVARQFRIPGGQIVNLAHGPDSVLGLFSAKPGDLGLDPRFRPADSDTTRLTILAARRILMDSLVPQRPYTLSLEAKEAKAPQRKDLVRALVSINGTWEEAAFKESGGRYSITVPPSAIAALMVEFPTVADWAPAQPAAAVAMAFRGDSLVFSPGLTTAGSVRCCPGSAPISSLGPTGNVRMESSRLVPVESTLRVGLAPDRLYAYRVALLIPARSVLSGPGSRIPLSGQETFPGSHRGPPSHPQGDVPSSHRISVRRRDDGGERHGGDGRRGGGDRAGHPQFRQMGRTTHHRTDAPATRERISAGRRQAFPSEGAGSRVLRG